MADPQTWVARLALVPEAKRDQHTIQLARAWAGQSPEQAVGWVQTFSPGRTRAEAVAAIAGTWVTQDPSGAATWVAAMSPGSERDRSAGSLATGLANRYPSQALDWALSIDDLQMRNMTALQVLLQVKARDAEAARRLIQAAAAPPATKAFLDKVISMQPGR